MNRQRPIQVNDLVEVIDSGPSMNGMRDRVRRISEPYIVLANGYNFRRDRLLIIEEAEKPKQEGFDL